MDLCKYTEELWRKYFVNNLSEILEFLNGYVKDDVILIGTGKHEFYENYENFINSVQNEFFERENIFLEITSFVCNEKKLNNDISLVYGCFDIKGSGDIESDNVIIDMTTRFSVIYHKENDKWKVVHIHQSVPDIEQKDGEAYSKILIDEFNVTKQKLRELEEIVATDHLTGLLNYKGFFSKCNELILSENELFYCMIIDVDDFKIINDTYGHQEGDNVLKEFGIILRNIVSDKGISGRIGGDEFALFFANIMSEDDIKNIANSIVNEVTYKKTVYDNLFPGVSVGISILYKDEDYKKAFKRADDILYKVKNSGKNNFDGIYG